MKNRLVVCFLISAVCSTVAFGSTIKSVAPTSTIKDGLQKVLTLKLDDSPLTKGSSVYTFDIYHGKLFLINKHNLLQIDLKTGVISNDLKASTFLARITQHRSISKIVVTDSGYYLSCLDEIYFIDKLGRATLIYKNTNVDVILDFNIEDDKILFTSHSQVKLITRKGVLISTLPFEMSDAQQILTNKGLSYNGDNIFEFNANRNGQILTHKYALPSKALEDSQLTVAFNGGEQLIGFSYNKRDCLYLFKKNLSRSGLIKTIKLDQRYAGPMEMNDEGYPNFRVIERSGVHYLVLIYNKKLNVFTFKV